jgi:hypothetical protein
MLSPLPSTHFEAEEEDDDEDELKDLIPGPCFTLCP